jgi:hypothetical protein
VDSIKCVKLIPKNRPLSTCESISFKIGFSISMENVALNSSIVSQKVLLSENSSKDHLLHQTWGFVDSVKRRSAGIKDNNQDGVDINERTLLI